jgi:DNA adenine methylase
MIQETRSPRPALRYYGGKFKIADWIISFFPEHIQYVEPCGGVASVLLRKEPAKLETFNDLDGRIVNFFQVLRDRPDELIRQIRLTPWARAEFERCQAPAADPLESARRWFVLCWQSISKPGGSWRSMHNYLARPRSAPMDGIEIDHLHIVAERFKRVQLEQRDALVVIRQYQGAETLIYFDPPYLGSTRVNKKYYAFEVDEPFHTAAAGLLLDARGSVVVSGYASQLYAELYEARGWVRRDKIAVTAGGTRRVESIWLSPRTVQALAGRGGL